ncbi:MAG TPA: tRNA (adenosine(37)-N6)-dimethylallyltransferase MiaA [Fredinandcohnia sp.]|nr:tRNA (adenosine(37)-N6)-dimethylallyltransferase MiaA [Fredinandcohnia sp.]
MEAEVGGFLAAVVGPTASGKTALALELARRIPLEVISCDSQAVYRGMDVGTAKPTPEERAEVAHHLVDVAAIGEDFSVARYIEIADAAIAGVRARGKLPLVVGGTGLYLRALLFGIVEAPPKDEALRARLEALGGPALHRRLEEVDPEAAARIPPGDLVRLVRALEVYELTGKPISEHHRAHVQKARYRALVLGVTPPRAELYRRVDERAVKMVEAGLFEETRRLAKEPAARAHLRKVIGYAEALEVLEGKMGEAEAIARIQQAQRHYAKRQLTWFRKMDVRWLPWPPDPDAVAEEIRQARDFPGETAGRAP